MAENLRFIRKNGRVIPIHAKDPNKKQMQKNYAKHGDGANQASRIDDKYDKMARKGTAGFSVVAAAGGLGAVALKGKKALAAGVVGVAAAIMGGAKIARQSRKLEGKKENAYVKAFGMGSEGQRPFKKKKGSSVY